MTPPSSWQRAEYWACPGSSREASFTVTSWIRDSASGPAR
jgi:hypothetical protein